MAETSPPAAMPRILIVAGSDSGGGAGIQADIKTVSALGGYAATAITALTVQDTVGVHDVMLVPPEIVAHQMAAVLADIGAEAIKIGMLPTTGCIEAVAAALADHAVDCPLVLDPVMVASSGDRLMDEAAVTALKALLVPRAHLLTPNVAEAELLTGLAITTPDHAARAGKVLQAEGAANVLVTGVVAGADLLSDVLVTEAGAEVFQGPRLATRHTHGTGCTLASAIAVGLARHAALDAAVAMARDYVLGAIRHAPGFGHGHGPLNHMWRQG
ncbi:MAG: bifunctional hydroxymethylpyrimidine kinase/phosphomethylpyrimidine kinase [Alphaproteobacteria bacterium]